MVSAGHRVPIEGDGHSAGIDTEGQLEGNADRSCQCELLADGLEETQRNVGRRGGGGRWRVGWRSIARFVAARSRHEGDSGEEKNKSRRD
jgi:hypothetical protein